MKRIFLQGVVLTALGTALFSTKAIFIKLAFQEQPNAALLLAWRMLFSLPVFIVVGLYAVRELRKHGQPLPATRILLQAMLAGLIGFYLSSLLDFEGLVYISAQLERLVLFTYPLIIMFIGWAFLGQSLQVAGIAGAAITYLGLMVVFLTDLPEGGRNLWIGTALVLGCAFTYAVYQLIAKRYIMVMGSLLFTSIAMTGSSVAIIAHFMITQHSASFDASPRFIALGAGTAVFATIIPVFLMNAGLARISAQTSAMIGTLSPILTIALAVWILGEPFTLIDAVGATLVIIGVALYALTDRKSSTTRQQLQQT